MVLYHANGTVVQAHEDYLERQAHKVAGHRYTDQIDVYEQRKAVGSTANVQIIIDNQEYTTLYCERAGDWEILREFEQAASYKISTTIDRQTLIACSTFAQEYFTYNPGANELHLPVCYPRTNPFNAGKQEPDEHNGILEHKVLAEERKVTHIAGDKLAFIRPREIEEYIVPWLKRVEEQFEKAKAPRSEPPGKPTTPQKRTKLARYLVSRSDLPLAMGLPDALVDKIHLYNAMLQLGLPKFVQLPLIDALVLQMYRTKLKACELDTLEHTIGRFYSRGVAVLDPVLNHFIGTYSFRSLGDRTEPEPPSRSAKLAEDTDAVSKEPAEETREEASTESETGQETNKEQADSTPKEADNSEPNPESELWKRKRKYLDYGNFHAAREDYEQDTYILPPELPVLGHSIRHWSGVRRNQSTAAAHTGFPLNIGKYKKFIRRSSRDAIDVNDCFEEETNRLIGQKYYQEHGPGKDKQ